MAKDLGQGIEPAALARPESYFVRGMAKLSEIADFEEFMAQNQQELKAEAAKLTAHTAVAVNVIAPAP